MSGNYGQLRDLLDAAAGEPPHRVSVEAVRRRVARRRVMEGIAGAAAIAVIAAAVPLVAGTLGRGSAAPQTAPGVPCPTLTIAVDGSVAPLFCANGTDNPAALAYYQGGWVKGFSPKMLTLPATASYSQVVGAACADIFGHGSPMGLQTEQQAYDLAANRAGWRYRINTVNGLTCPVVGTWAPGGQGYGQVEPETISNNGDPASLVTHIAWSSWGGVTAYGTGISAWVPPGQPTVHGVQEPVTVVAFNRGTCAGQPSYNAVEWYFPQHGQQFSSDRYFNACTGQRAGTG